MEFLCDDCVKVKVELFGLLQERFPGYDAEQGLSIDLPEEATVADLFSHFNLETGVAIVNHVALKADDRLEKGTCISLVAMVSGG